MRCVAGQMSGEQTGPFAGQGLGSGLGLNGLSKLTSKCLSDSGTRQAHRTHLWDTKRKPKISGVSLGV